MYKWLLSICLLFSISLNAQNLVPNPSFEEHKYCPVSYTVWEQDEAVIGWHNIGTPDYYNVCCSLVSEVSVPKNIAGFQYAHSGKGYMGMYPGLEDIYAELETSLIKDSLYYVRLYVCLADTSVFAISSIQVLFSNNLPSERKITNSLGIYGPAQLSNPVQNFIVDTKNWVLLSWIYKAQGDEKYITIGNFKSQESTPIKRIKKGISMPPYYLIDDICVSRLKQDGSCDCGDSNKDDKKAIDSLRSNKLVIATNTNIILNNVFFESGKSQLLLASFKELDQLVSYLKINEKVEIEIIGYTDNSGSEDKNKALSAARAKAVADYLIAKGISKMRVVYKGLGCVNPVAGNETIEGKAKNRRVEFRITNK
ncbi:MAG TPA: OmpA family protein [Bacteroidia bacterium]|jgi:OOP family OmpA-OmpF porin|nr:OmpA family protein [Bacteroidia bacterium]